MVTARNSKNDARCDIGNDGYEDLAEPGYFPSFVSFDTFISIDYIFNFLVVIVHDAVSIAYS